jgi:hypothetical protein
VSTLGKSSTPNTRAHPSSSRGDAQRDLPLLYSLPCPFSFEIGACLSVLEGSHLGDTKYLDQPSHSTWFFLLPAVLFHVDSHVHSRYFSFCMVSCVVPSYFSRFFALSRLVVALPYCSALGPGPSSCQDMSLNPPLTLITPEIRIYSSDPVTIFNIIPTLGFADGLDNPTQVQIDLNSSMGLLSLLDLKLMCHSIEGSISLPLSTLSYLRLLK